MDNTKSIMETNLSYLREKYKVMKKKSNVHLVLLAQNEPTIKYTMLVKNLPVVKDYTILFLMLLEHPGVHEIRLPVDRDTSLPWGTAFVVYTNEDDLQAAMAYYGSTVTRHRQLTVERCTDVSRLIIKNMDISIPCYILHDIIMEAARPTKVTVRRSRAGSNKYAIVEFSHDADMRAERKKLIPVLSLLGVQSTVNFWKPGWMLRKHRRHPMQVANQQ